MDLRGQHSVWPLFDHKSTSVESPYIYLPAEFVAEFMSFGFAHKVVDQPECRQVAALWVAVTSNPGDIVVEDNGFCGGGTYHITNPYFTVIDEFPVSDPSCADWELDSCSNIRLLDTPGCYRLVLNDPAAVGVVRVYMKLWPKAYMKRYSCLYFGG